MLFAVGGQGAAPGVATLSHDAETLPKDRLLFKVGKYLSVERLVYVYTFKCLRDCSTVYKVAYFTLLLTAGPLHDTCRAHVYSPSLSN